MERDHREDIGDAGMKNIRGDVAHILGGQKLRAKVLAVIDHHLGVTRRAGRAENHMYDKAEVAIDPKDNYTSLAHKISEAGKALILKDLMPYLNGKLPGVPQDEAAVTIAHIIKPENEKIPLDLPAKDFVNYVRGLSETPGGYLMLGNLKLKIYGAHRVNDQKTAPLGQIVLADKSLVFQGSDGQISIDVLQLEGKKKMDARSFLNGAHGLRGETLA